MPDTSDPIARLTPAPSRRTVSSILMLGLAIVFIYIGLTGRVQSVTGQVFAIALGVAALMVAWRSHQSRHLGLVLTEAGLADTDGHMLAPLDQILSVDRGAFAFKPSNGFILRLNGKAKSGWVPGLWWRVGDRLGIGGTSAPAETRVMADRLGLLLAERDGSGAR